MPHPPTHSAAELDGLKSLILQWSRQLGFQQLGVSDIDLSQAEQRLNEWLGKNYHGEMGYMSRHGTKRSRPAELLPNTCRVISVRMDYFPEDQDRARRLLDHDSVGYVSRYALGRDYHKVLRRRLAKLAQRIDAACPGGEYRAFTDSAPVLEKALGASAGLGWMGKHTLLLDKQAGSWFFLGEIYTNLPLPADEAVVEDACGKCNACITVCPTQAIVAPGKLDARRCISYLTIEHHGTIPEPLRKAMGNRIYGCPSLCGGVPEWCRDARS